MWGGRPRLQRVSRPALEEEVDVRKAGGVGWGHGLKGASMTITVNITPEIQAELARQAAAYGRAIEAYAASLLEEAVNPPAGALTGAEKRSREGRKSLREVFEAL